MQVLFGYLVSDLVRQRRNIWSDADVFRLTTGIDPGVMYRVERGGMDASLRDLILYADAVGVELTIRHDPKTCDNQTKITYRQCTMCGSSPSIHPQRHSTHLGACVDETLFELMENLWALQIVTVTSCQGDSGGTAHIVFRDVDDLRALLTVIERHHPLAERAGVGDDPARRQWSGSLTWSHHRDGIVLRTLLRIPFDDVTALTEATSQGLSV